MVSGSSRLSSTSAVDTTCDFIVNDNISQSVDKQQNRNIDFHHVYPSTDSRSAGNFARDRQLARFYAPQLDQHIDSLSLAIEDFLGTVENNLPPRDFVQKGKMIILAAHKLIYIGDTVSQCVLDRTISNSLRQFADRLCELLKECVKAMKLASEEYPELKSMQGMIDSIIAVSKTAHEIKMLVKQFC
ncbi:neural precursor cell expressed, developmentally down-regulated 9 [Parelaphostrongylus tenuis]|uniref:Neural cell expressed, developmentally down-regulated 9 n=1 Tax=Parelaphostrongylus tenuis TaxID=148309 RepID=A0AAD5N524_PARTN|nr:neural precursor cell expressed, developmentally down-regulated 9 [Parelaphostrongylus tenuis]